MTERKACMPEEARCEQCETALEIEGCPRCDYNVDMAAVISRRLGATLNEVGAGLPTQVVVQGCAEFMGKVLAQVAVAEGEPSQEAIHQRLALSVQRVKEAAWTWVQDLMQDC
jgi:hypothetical protein